MTLVGGGWSSLLLLLYLRLREGGVVVSVFTEYWASSAMGILDWKTTTKTMTKREEETLAKVTVPSGGISCAWVTCVLFLYWSESEREKEKILFSNSPHQNISFFIIIKSRENFLVEESFLGF